MAHTRREFLQTGISLAALSMLGVPAAFAQSIDNLVIAYNTGVPNWDPTTGASGVNPKLQPIYLTVFDRYIQQEPDLSFTPGLLTKWGFSDDKKHIHMTVREGVKWHDGSDFGPEDVVFSLERAADPKSGNPGQFVWGKFGNYKIDGNTITGDVLEYEPTVFKWMAFLTGYVLPKAYFEKVGPEGFEKAPIGTGPYKIDNYERGAYVRLVANKDYWRGKPAYDVVTIKFVPDAASRVAEVESGNSHVTLEIPYEEYDRLKAKPGLKGEAFPVADVGMIFLNDIGPMLDKNVRLAAHHAIDKQLIIDRLLRGYGVPLSTLDAPEYDAFDPSLKFEYDPEKAKQLLAASGYSTDKPVRFKIQTTRGYKPKDYEMIQAIVGMWRRVGIEAEIEIYEIAKHFELRAADQLAPAAFYNWGNAIGDPTTSTGHAMFGPSPHSVWDTDDLDEKIMPLWGETDEAKRIKGWRDVSAYIMEQGYVIPLLQYVMPVIHSDKVVVPPAATGDVTPATSEPPPARAAAASMQHDVVSMLKTILARLASMALTLFGVAIVVFVLIRVAPGNPIAMMLPPGATQADIAQLTAMYGLDKSLFEQFVIWAGNALHGDFGTSITLRQPVWGLVLERLPATLELSLLALFIAVALGGATAILGARGRGRSPEAGVDLFNGVTLSIPDFLWGLLLILLFGVLWPVLHISGRVSPHLSLPFSTQFYLFEAIVRLRFDLVADLLAHMLMPALSLALPLAAIISQLLKQGLKEVLEQDYTVLARVRGFTEIQVILREALRNAALPTLTLIGVQFTFLIGGTVIVERLFAYEGLGNMAIDAVINRDLPLIQGIVLTFAGLFILINLAVDLAYTFLNPRLRHG